MASSSRTDGRQPLETRAISTKLGALSRADGSARFSFGSTSSLASFAGPIEVRLREELPDRATLEVTHRPLEGVGGQPARFIEHKRDPTPSRALEASLISALTPLLALSQHPRSLVQLVIQSLSSPCTSYHTSSSMADIPDGPVSHLWPPNTILSKADLASPSSPYALSFAERSSALNAASLAILDAGAVSLRAVPLAVSLAYIPADVFVDVLGGIEEGGATREVQLVVDPSAEEERAAKSRFVFGWAFGEGVSTSGRGAEQDEDMEGEGGKEAELVWAVSEGSFSKAEFDTALEQSRVSASEILGAVREQLRRHISARLA
ncbi:uncharacterized protein MKK02DRAFT_32967 [Dioszegia hungarica]|uniref:Exoribonuclease phosphorolytic domain-containing protein n=1 Tax=Dioszegia hungarica TaxID=4972 RepID=A0AA38LUD2_9TREE|nr:uncharacterized protein MKK02DRAFT_32967 [Dioszegia hungarica]KAI9635580.1 hypothetical protein MKK02DRAFT_32967 [Dioszegia hungarica]